MNTDFLPDLTEREQLILKATVEDYIAVNKPIASFYLKSKHRFQWSPATIRNTLASLERKGFLTHPHTSSGRIPTDIGYRYYVDHLLEESPETIAEYNDILDRLTTVSNNIEELLQTTAAMLAKVSHLFSIVVLRQYNRSIVTDIELVYLSSERVIMVLAMNSGLIQSMVFNLQISVSRSMLALVTSILKERLLGLTLAEIQASIDERLRDTDIYNHEIVQILVKRPKEHFSVTENKLTYSSSLAELLSYPEFQQIDNLQKTLPALEDINPLELIPRTTSSQIDIVTIGQENPDQRLKECTVMATTFENVNLTGQLGVIGPLRIPYPTILTILKNFSEIMKHVY